VLCDIARDVSEARLCNHIGVAGGGVQAEYAAGNLLAQLVKSYSFGLRGAAHRREQWDYISCNTEDERLVELELQPKGPGLDEPVMREEAFRCRLGLFLNTVISMVVKQVRS
jgi:hypothetical protein